MSKPLVSTGAYLPEHNCDVITVKNYGTTDIATGQALKIDATNLDTTQGLIAVTPTAETDSLARCGIAVGIIPAGGVGEMAVGGFVRGLSDSTAFTAGQFVGGVADGKVAVSATAGAKYGFIVKAETTTTPLIMLTWG
jgi:hypothetical protein